MDLRLITDKLFPGENVAPDLSSYDAMVAKWRGSRPPPTFDECVAAEAQIVEEIPREVLIEKEIVSNGYDIQIAVAALMRWARDGDRTQLEELFKLIDSAEAKFPEKNV